jgi:hypothetical protein
MLDASLDTGRGQRSGRVEPMLSRGVVAVTLSILMVHCGCAAQVFPAATPPNLTPQMPMTADAFVDSIGVNTHLTADLTLDGTYAVVVQRMKEIGIRHIRDGIFPKESSREYADQRKFFTATGVRMDAITDCRQPLGYYPGSYTSPYVIRTFDARVGGAVEMLEGPNEPDLRRVPRWPSLTIACVKENDLTKALPVPFVAPAMGNAIHGDPAKLGNIAGLVDFGAIHRYFSPGWNPGWAGYGRDACGSIESLAWAICEAKVNSGSDHAVDVTETGYTTHGEYASHPAEVDEITDGKYLSRVLLVDSLGGIARTYIYEFHDDGHDKVPWENGFGLIRYDGLPKPAFNAVRSEIAVLSDPGPGFSPQPLRYDVEARISTIEHELFQKRDGTYVLAVWNETASWNPITGRDIPVRPVDVRIELPYDPIGVRFRALRDDGTFDAVRAHIVVATITIPVDDHVGFLSFSSARAVSPTRP